jgi:predicted chitinase
MRGIAGITGPSSPLIGQDAFYEVTKLYPGTVVSNYSAVQWKVYREASGHWIELKGTLKTGKRVSFNFPQKWYGKRLLIEAFLNNPEKKSPPGLIISPKQGPKKIKSVELRDANDKAFTQKPKYGQSVTTRILTENMLGDTLKLSIWERDTLTSTGHDPSGNTKLWSGTIKVTETNGLAKKKIVLSPAMMAESNKSYFEGGEHEYYILVEADNTAAKISKETAVQNEILLSPRTPGNMPPAAPKPQATPAPKASPTLTETAMEYLKQLKISIVNALSIDDMPATGQTATTVNTNKVVNCGERYCIKKGAPKSELIREINIRLSGFGGNVPTDEFTDRTEKMVKQFQRDYMKIPETGRVCGNTLLAIDDFSLKFDISHAVWNTIDCSCSTKGKTVTSKLREIAELNKCNGWGDGTGKGTYKTGSEEKNHKYEYPGIHRSLLFGVKAMFFYLSVQETYSFRGVSSGYRCRFKNFLTTNHQGKAIDLQFNKGTWQIQGAQEKNLAALRDIKDKIFAKYLDARTSWPDKNYFSLEPIDLKYTKNGKIDNNYTYSWIHMDVREFDSEYLEDKYFCKDAQTLNGKNIILMAKEAGFEKTCTCVEGKATVKPAGKAVAGCYCTNEFTEEILQKVAPNASKVNVTKYLDGFNKTFEKYSINSCLKKAHFFAQVIHESGSFKDNVEQGNAAYLAKYNGWHGRGLIQLTLKENYEAFGKAVGEDFTSSAENREKVKDSPYAVYSAGWFWSNRNLNALSEENDFIFITYKVNGGFNNIDDRLKNIKTAFEALYNDCKNDSGKTTDYKLADSKGNDNAKCCFAWGLWHDPLFDKDGCTKNKALAIEGYQRYVDLTSAGDTTTNYYKIQNYSHFADIAKLVKKGKKTVKQVNVREAALKRIAELKK